MFAFYDNCIVTVPEAIHVWEGNALFLLYSECSRTVQTLNVFLDISD